MERYDYRKAIREDILEYFKEHDITGFVSELEHERLYDNMFIDDSVTGNASGSYTLSTWQAEENICHNFDIIDKLQQESGKSDKGFDNAEYWDVSIRCYLLVHVLNEVISEWNKEHPEQDEDEDEEDIVVSVPADCCEKTY